MFLHSSKFNSLIFLLFSRNEIEEIFLFSKFNFSNFSNFDIIEQSFIKILQFKNNSLIFLFFPKNEIS